MKFRLSDTLVLFVSLFLLAAKSPAFEPPSPAPLPNFDKRTDGLQAGDVVSGNQRAVITGFSPASGIIGTSVTISGLNFSPVVSSNLVRFGGFRSIVLAAGSNSLTVVVPVGATRSPLTVTVNGMTAYANAPFLVTYPNAATRVVAWGFNNEGQTNVPSGLTNVVAIAAAACNDHNLALKTDGTMVAWGYNNHGQATVPAGLSNVVIIAAGGYHNLVLKNDGTVAAWGYNSDWNGTYGGQATVPASLSNAVAIGAGWYYSLGLKPDGTVLAWGVNSNGQTNVPAGLSNVVAIASAPCYSLALKVDGTVVAWGTNYNTPGGIPVQLMDAPPGLSNVVAIAAGYFHCLALKADGTVVVWGENYYGQTNVPAGLTNVVAIAAGSYNNLALKADGKMVGWGFFIPDLPPSGLTNVVAVGAGYYHSLALVSDSSFGAPSIISQPTNQTMTAGGTATFTVTASGTPPLSYQWAFTGTNIAGATNTSLILTDVQLNQAGNYAVLVANAYGSVLSSNAVLTVNPPLSDVPVITGFNPISGVVGTTVTIFGTNFSPVATSNLVYFGAVRAVVTAASVTNLVMTVPAGATYAPITETVNGLVAYANTAFEPTFPGDGSDIGPSSFAPRVDLAGGSGSYLTIIADLDGDGKPDLVVANYYDQNLSLFRNISTNGTLNVNSFAPRVDLPAIGGAPGGLAVADVDGDGKLDLVVSDYINNRVMIFRNISSVGTLTTNSFVVPVAFSVGNSPVTVRVRDLDGDGRPDIACVSYGENTLSILRNIGVAGDLTTNSFAPRVVLATGNGPHDLVIADLDGDGKPDLAQVNYNSSFLSVFRNVSVQGVIDTNSFAARVDFAASGQGDSIVVGDVDGDGKVDLVVGWASGSAVAVYRNLASPGFLDTNSFAAEVDFPAPGWVRGVAMGDLNGDDKPDISLVGESGNFMSVYQNVSMPGSFTNTSLASRVDYGAGWNPHGESIGDLDGDGRPDIIFGNQYDSTISIYQNVVPLGGAPIITAQPTNQMVTVGGTASFSVTAGGTPPLSYQWNFNGTNILGATNTTLTLTNVQLNQAGNYAALVTNAYGSILSSNTMLTVNPPPSFGVPVIFAFSPISGTIGTSVTISGTNFSPVAASNVVYFGAVQAVVTAASATNLVVPVPVGATYAPITVTVNGLTAYANQPFMPTFFGDGSGITVNSFAPRLDLASGSGPIRVIIADLDGDGKPDLVVANDYNNSISLYRNISTNGSLTAGSFAPRVDLVTPPGSYSPFGLVVADVDGDGKLDIIASDYDESIVSVYRNTCTPGNISSNAFATRVDFATGAQPQGVEVRDIDGDGKPDLLVANSGDGTVSILRNTGVMGNLTTNSFAPKVDIATGSGCQGVAAGDLDGDGKPDVVTVNSGNGTVSLLRNISTPGSITTNSFAAKVDIAVLSGAVQVAVGDLDGDGKPDLTVTFYFPQTVSVLRNTSTVGSLTTNSFAPRIDYSLGGRGHTPAIADLDGDGKPDVAVVTELDSLLSIFRNVSTPGSFTNSSLADRVDFSTGYNAWGVSVGDLDGDGRPDIIFCNAYDNTISIYRNVVPLGGAPIITAQPTNQMVTVGGTASFSVTAGGTPPLSYQWNFNGTNILGATNTTLTLTNVQLNQAGNYAALVTNAYGSILSSNTMLTVNPLPPCAPVSSGLISWWSAEGNANDIVGVNNGTLVGGAGFAAGEVGQAFSFDGSSGYVSIPDSPLLDSFTTSITIELWLKVNQLTANSDWKGIVTKGNSSWRLQATTFANTVTFSTTGVSPNEDLYGTRNFNDGQWHHVAAVYDGTNMFLYVDGTLDVSQPATGLINQNSSPVCIGANMQAWTGGGVGLGYYLNGLVDEASIYNRALTASEIQLIYAAGSGGKCALPPTIPTIITQPTNQAVYVGFTAAFSVVASGTPPLSYQWNFNGTNILGATNTTLTLTNVQVSQAGNYAVLATNAYGSVLSSNAVLTVFVPAVPPTIVSQTPSQVVLLGNAATFNVTASGSDPLSYFWKRNGAIIPGATNFSYTLNNAQLSDSGSKFSCLVTNAYGLAASTNATLKVIDSVSNDLCSGAVVVTSFNYTNAQSTTKATSIGDPVPDCVAGFGNGVWYQFTPPSSGFMIVDTFGSDFDTGLAVYTGTCDALTETACNDDTGGVNSQVIIPATAGTTYSILAGGYSAHAGNLVFHLTYLTPPAFVVQPTNQSVVVSSNASFSTTVSGTQPISFQWYFNNTPLVDGGRISGSTNTTLNIASIQTNDAGNYQLVASNIVGVATSSVASLTAIILPPVIIQQPVDQAVVVGSNVTFTAVVDGTPPYGYQWYFNGSALSDDARISGSTTAALSISNITTADAGSYALTVTNVSGSTNSTSAVLTVLVPPSVTTQPIGRSVPPGLPTTFNAAASGNPAPTYQWQLNGTNIPGATSSSYTIAAVGTNDLGFYHLVASNLAGVVVSADAQLTFGPVAAWGRNLNNECLPPPNLSNVLAVAGTYQASFAVRTDGSIATWGSGAATNIPASASNVVAISTYANTANYALRSDGRVISWAGTAAPNLSNIVAVAAGYNGSYALRAEGTLTNWSKLIPDFPAGLNHLTAIAAGYNNAIALKSDGTIVVAGSGVVTNVPSGLSNVVAIAAGYTYAMALKADGKVVAWGSGTGTNLPAGMTNIAAISAGNYPGENFGLAIRSNGTVVVWGDNPYGETSPPAALTNLISIAGTAAAYHGLALVNDGSPVILHPPVGLTAYTGRDVVLHGDAAGAQPLSYQWLLNGTNIPGATNTSLVISNVQSGNAGNYQLFVSNAVNTALSLPAPLTVISNNALVFLSVPAGQTNYQGNKISLGVTVLGNGPLRYQWFFSVTNKNYAAILGATNDTLILDPALAVNTGNYCVAVSNQFAGITNTPVYVRVLFARAWGFQAVSNPPVNVTNAIAIATGGYQNYYGHYFALGSDGKLTSWANYPVFYGETNVSALSNSTVIAIAAGSQSSLALRSDGTVYAWGYGYYGQTNPPSGLNNVVAIACGDYHDLALKSDGTVIAWGQNLYGEGTNSLVATNAAVAIAAGTSHNLGLRADGTVFGWGYNSYGQTTIPFNATNVIAIAAGQYHSLALRANGTVVGWGNNGNGQVSIPAGLSNVVAISASSSHSTMLRADGTVVSLGYEYTGYASNAVPSDLANVIAISSGGDHDFGLLGTRAPAFTVQPWNRTIALNARTNITLAAKCAGVQPVFYQWQLNGTNVPGATNDMLILTNQPSPQFGPVRFIPTGAYQLIASNAYGVVASKYAKLTVIIPLADALDTPTDGKGISLYNWTTTGNAQWFGETNVTHDGVDAARSGAIGALQETILQTTLATNWSGRCTFWWKVSSEQYFDILEFRVNGIVQTNISGEVDWQQASIPVAAGTNVLQWRYSKDASFDAGQDAGWVDQFAFISDPPVITNQPASQTVNMGATVFLTVTAGGAPQLKYQWRQNGNIVGGNSPTLILGNVGRAQNGTYFVTVTNSGGSTVSSNAVLKVLVPQLLASPKLLPDGSFQLTSTDANGGLLQPSDLANFEAQASTNLLDWETLTNALSLTNGMLRLQDPASTNDPMRFYRILEH